jgi:hypothetical protein
MAKVAMACALAFLGDSINAKHPETSVAQPIPWTGDFQSVSICPTNQQ